MNANSLSTFIRSWNSNDPAMQAAVQSDLRAVLKQNGYNPNDVEDVREFLRQEIPIMDRKSQQIHLRLKNILTQILGKEI